MIRKVRTFNTAIQYLRWQRRRELMATRKQVFGVM